MSFLTRYVAIALPVVVACGGATQSTGATDAGHSDGAHPQHDSGTSDAAACVADPVVGAACAAGAKACDPGNACCGGLWVCDGVTHAWDREQARCACLVDAGHVMVDAGHDAGMVPDGGTTVASCSACSKDEVCATTTTSGGACEQPNDAGMCPGGGTAAPGTCCNNSSTSYKCFLPPSACTSGLTCACASSLCTPCMCQGPGSDGSLTCACDEP